MEPRSEEDPDMDCLYSLHLLGYVIVQQQFPPGEDYYYYVLHGKFPKLGDLEV